VVGNLNEGQERESVRNATRRPRFLSGSLTSSNVNMTDYPCKSRHWVHERAGSHERRPRLGLACGGAKGTTAGTLSEVSDTMLATGQPFDDLKRPISDALAISDVVTQSSLRHEVVHDYNTAVLQRKWGWLLTRAAIVLVSIAFSFIILFPLSRSSWLPTFRSSGPIAGVSWDAKSDDVTFPMPALSSNGRTDQVQWDKYTLALRGQRVLLL